MDKLEYYKQCYEDCKKVLKEVSENPRLTKKEKEQVVDHFLDLMNKFKSYIDYLTLND